MTANLYQGEGGYTSVVGQKSRGQLPERISRLANDIGRFSAMNQGSVGPTMSDLQFAMENERRQHEDAYRYAHGGHANDNVPLGKPSF